MGSGTRCSFDSPCSLTGARDQVRQVNREMTGDIYVILRGGAYNLSSPFALTQQDSGSNGYGVIYQAYHGETPVLSGGIVIAGWSLHDASAGLYRAPVDRSLQTRQLYVNGLRATRARGPTDPSGFSKTPAGFTTTDAALQEWRNIAEVEIVSFSAWKSFRCRLASIAELALIVQNPCWTNAQLHPGWSMDNVTWVENAYELLDEPGEWYHDRAEGYLYYIPRAGEDLSTARVVAPTLEALLVASGTLEQPIHHIQFVGLTFAYATWLGPDTDDGYAVTQAGFHITGSGWSGLPHWEAWTKTPAGVTFRAARFIRLERNVFVHLGGAGLTFEHGSQDNAIIGNRFQDISSSAIQIGDITDRATTDTGRMTKNHVIRSNYIAQAGAEYFDAAGIWVGYSDTAIIAHNEIRDLPYTGVSVGWGWGAGGSTYARDNRITNNLIQDVVHTLGDGGAIYTLGDQPGSTISGNYILGQRNYYGAIYLDEGTQHFQVSSNVLASVPWWLYIWNDSIQNNTVDRNYTDTPNIVSAGLNNLIGGNIVVADGLWPAEAQAIQAEAGLEPAYVNIRRSNVALGQPASASSTAGASYPAGHGNDGRLSEGWAPARPRGGGPPWWRPPWWQVDLGREYRIDSVEVVMGRGMSPDDARSGFEVWAANDGRFASYTVLGGHGPVVLPPGGTWVLNVTNPDAFRYIRIVKTGEPLFFMSELRVFGVGP